MKTLFLADRRAPCALLVLLSLPAAAQMLPARYRQTDSIPYVTGGQHRHPRRRRHTPPIACPRLYRPLRFHRPSR